MDDTTEPDAPTQKQTRRFKLRDILATVLLLAVITALLVTLIGKLQLKREVDGAKVVSDRLMSDISRQNAADARKLGDATFRTAHSETELGKIFVTLRSYAKGTTAVTRQIVTNDKHAQIVYIIYEYSTPPHYYIRAAVARTNSSQGWHLVGISGNNSEAPLVVK